MNSLQLEQIDGGTQVKQGDFGSLFAYKLLDEEGKSLDHLNGQTATVRLAKGDSIVFEKQVTVLDNRVGFNLDHVLKEGTYRVEIVVASYVFPSDNYTTIKIVRAANHYDIPKLEDILNLSELKRQLEALKTAGAVVDLGPILSEIEQVKSRLEELSSLSVSSYDDSELRAIIQQLQERVEKDTVYDDTVLRERLSHLESRTDSDTIYDDSEIKQEIEALKSRQTGSTYDDSQILERLNRLEAQADSDTIYDDSALRQRLEDLETKESSVIIERHGPTGWSLDRSVVPWLLHFDNGATLQLKDYPKTATVYGYGFPANLTEGAIGGWPLPHDIVRTSNGSVTIDKWKSGDGKASYWGDRTTVINPVQSSEGYDFTNALFNPLDKDDLSKRRQKNVIRVMYELGIWSEAEILGMGVVKK